MGAYGTPDLQSPNDQPPKRIKKRIGPAGIIGIVLTAIALVCGIAGAGWGPVLLFFGLVGLIIYLCSLIVVAIRKKDKRPSGIGMAGSAVVFILGAALMPLSSATSRSVATSSRESEPSSAVVSAPATKAVSSKAVLSSAKPSSAPSSKARPAASAKPKPAPSQPPVDPATQYKKECSTYKYKEIARNPNNYTGKKAKFTGQVVQVEESWGSDVIRLNVTKGQYGLWSDTIYVEYTPKSDNESRILENDIITVYGELSGIKTYTTVLMSDVSIPYLKAQYVDISPESNK